METKRKRKRTLEFEETVEDKDDEKVTSFLEERASLGDTDAMVTVAKRCARGRGTEQNAERAKMLFSEAAMKGNERAKYFMELIDKYDGKQEFVVNGLFNKNIQHSFLNNALLLPPQNNRSNG